MDTKGESLNSMADFILQLGTMCTDVEINVENNIKEASGEATEVAIANCALLHNQDKNELYKRMQRVNEISFDSDRK